MTNPHGPQLLVLVLALAGLAVWTLWSLKNRRQWLYAVPPLTWLVHVLIFYSAVFARDCFGLIPKDVEFTFWSAVLRLHAAFLVIGIGVVMLLERIIVKSD